ncbi:MAG: hypothetical protein FWG85_00435 [Bacteroidetes bacterium]|nr:hypothetical protein [Bacteroidota bacterium]
MKIILIVIGCILVLYYSISVVQYIWDYSILTEYGKGYVWGKLILLFLGIVITIVGVKKKKKRM